MAAYRLKILQVDRTENYYRVRFVDPGTVSECRTPAWAIGVSESVSKNSKVVMCVVRGKWKVQSVLITRKFHDNADARRLAMTIARKIEGTGKKVPKKWEGGRVEGPSHDEGGVIVELEGREGVLMTAVMDDPNPKMYSGTNREIVHQMQLEHGGNPMMANGGTVEPAEAWIELSYKDKNGIDWAKDRLTEDKVKSVLRTAAISCINGDCLAGSGITIDSGVRDIVYYVPVDQKEKAEEAIKQELEDLNIPPKEMKVRSGVTQMEKGGKVNKEMWIQKVDKEIEEDHTKGKFTRKALRHQMLPVAYAKRVLSNPERHTLTTRREAQFIKNVNPDKFKMGGVY